MNRKRVHFAAGAALATGLVALPSIAVANCGTHDDIVRVLAKKYSEAPRAVATVNDSRLVEIYVSEKGSWTILVTKAGGKSCIIAAGQDWEDVPVAMRSLDPKA